MAAESVGAFAAETSHSSEWDGEGRTLMLIEKYDDPLRLGLSNLYCSSKHTYIIVDRIRNVFVRLGPLLFQPR